MNDKYLNYRDFADIDSIFTRLKEIKEEHWRKGLEEKALDVFHLASQTPAYQKLLKEFHIKAKDIKTFADFKALPIMSKSNYLNKYELDERLLTPVSKIKSFYMSSGSTGEPGIWPRFSEANEAYSIFVNFIYELYWSISKKKSLYITALDLGIWASGNLQFHAAMYCSERNDFTFANTGADFTYIYSVIKKLHKYYDQIIISAYPSFARRLLDYLIESDLDLKKIKLGFMLGGEPHTIEWRHYILGKLGKEEDDVRTVIDYYGTSDSGGPGLSTPLTHLIQNLSYKDKALCKDLFKQSVVPSLFQQNPLLFVESIDGKIIITYPGQLPLCRYDSGDTGTILRFSHVEKLLRNHGYDIYKLLDEKKCKDVWEWPLIYLTGRSDYAIAIGGAVVYPKDIEGLFFQDITKDINSFKMSVKEDSEHRYHFVIYIELKEKNSVDLLNTDLLKEKLKTSILERLITVNLDYAAAYEMDKESCDPEIIICEFNSEPFSGDRKKPKSNFIAK
jgi:phenylacetate-CoA ligase